MYAPRTEMVEESMYLSEQLHAVAVMTRIMLSVHLGGGWPRHGWPMLMMRESDERDAKSVHQSKVGSISEGERGSFGACATSRM